MKKIAVYSLLLSVILTACAPHTGSAVVIKEGKIKSISKEHLLIEEKSSVVSLDFEGGSGKHLAEQYRAGQGIKLVAIKTIDKEGNSSESIEAIIFEDGRRFNISG